MKNGVDHIGITVVYCCHDDAGRVLMAKRSQLCRDEKGCWDIGGGSLEFGETIEDALKREIAEEYGTDVLSYEFLGYRDVHREIDGAKTHWVALDFRVHVDHAKAKNGEPTKFDDVQWFLLDALPAPIHSQLPTFLQKYRAKL